MSPARPFRFLRFFRSELSLIFRRRRNLALLTVLALVPVFIGVAVKLAGHPGRGGTIIGGVTDNGLFAALAALLVAVPLFLPLAVAVVAGDAVAGEASSGTLRYLLAVPVGRTRLLAVKLSAVVAWVAACVLVVTVAGVLVGLVLFPTGELTLLSGRDVSYGNGLLRLLAITGYVVLVEVSVAAIGLFVSTLTEVPIAAMAATLTVVVISEVVDAVPQVAAIHGWLPSHYWLQWVDVLRDPVVTDRLAAGVFATLGYVAFFVALAWARFGGKDITS